MNVMHKRRPKVREEMEPLVAWEPVQASNTEHPLALLNALRHVGDETKGCFRLFFFSRF